VDEPLREVVLRLHLQRHNPSCGGGTNKRGQIERENPEFWGSGRPRAAGNPSKRWGAKPPTFLRGSRSPGAAQTPKSRIFLGTPNACENALVQSHGCDGTVLLKDPGVLFKDPEVLLKDPGVL